ncbi:glycosyltransferase family 4 protein [Streptomyces sp. NPDC102384]|uniref:glycosyltransferase family 4 protein n=1 Tax=Streptomyces sp. NPDC102384 TaxID=3366166 RepID=UPI0038021211
MRLLIITSSFHPVIGGAETYVFEVARALAQRGHAVAIVTDVPRGALDGPVEGDPLGVNVYRLGGYRELLADPSKIHWEQMAFGIHPELSWVVNRFRPDLVLTNSLDVAVIGKIVSLDRGIPWVATFHEQAPEREPLGEGRLQLIYGQLSPSLVLAGSQFYAERARRFGARVELIYHGVDTDMFHPDKDPAKARRRYGYSGDHIVIVCAGRLKQRKGILEALQAFATVHTGHPETRLLLVGSVNSASLSYAAQLESEIERLQLGAAVTIDREVTFDQMPDTLAAADIVTQPSLEEGLGLAVLEAMSVGRPTITTDIPGIQEILTMPGIAITVPPGEAKPLAAALQTLVVDSQKRAELGARGRTHVVEHFSRPQMVAKTEAALQAVALRNPSMMETRDVRENT